MKSERLQKYIARSGVTSRRKAEELILSGKVKVNEKTVTELGTKVDPESDIVLVNNQKIFEVKNHVYIKLYKPEGYVTTVKDQFNRKTVMDLINAKERVYPVGRLDYNTSGLLLLTNDGDLANKLMHPKYNIYKTYIAEAKGRITEDSMNILRTGVVIENYKTAPARVKLIKYKQYSSIVQISIHEGKNRQVRKMFEAVGHNVTELKRTSLGKINLGDLNPGCWKYLNNEEIQFLKNNQEG
ncbi:MULTISPECIES: pseudouridine synthase [unclassified Sedimentibacter]|uniref:pseudouridine synthase n=1 Tax=unclassified Sedimentibacter TaxID=2649220 RepID=UPI0027E10B1B|nr:pseudouridine synthase [Sedimentibacter sp. MB35-C1]WMJ76220.1 pseudouridine synthase [Sedimentibacter sp. MB35-C1]